jgi:hypothetical protein
LDEVKATEKLQELVDAQKKNVSWDATFRLAEWRKVNLRFREGM